MHLTTTSSSRNRSKTKRHAATTLKSSPPRLSPRLKKSPIHLHQHQHRHINTTITTLNNSPFHHHTKNQFSSNLFSYNPYRQMSSTTETTQAQEQQTETFTAGVGCYWGLEHYLRKNFQSKFPNSILDVQVGFMGGKVENPTYRQVCTGSTEHVEVAHVIFDKKYASYADFVKFVMTLHDPTTLNAQGGDIGTQYASVIFYANDEQKTIAENVIADLQQRLNDNKIVFKKQPYKNKTITTQLRPLATFYSAHDEHQQYLIKNPDGYCNHAIRFDWNDQL